MQIFKQHFGILLLLLGSVLVFASCNRRDHKSPIDGEWQGNHYVNKRALFEVDVPDGLVLSAPRCIDNELKSIKVHAYLWEIRSKKGKEGELLLFEPVSDDDNYDYINVYKIYQEDADVQHLEGESIWNWFRMKIAADIHRGKYYVKEIAYVRYDSQLKLMYYTDSEYHNPAMETFANNMEVRAIYANLMAGNAKDLLGLWFGLLSMLMFIMLFISNKPVLSVITIILIAAANWQLWRMTGIHCGITYVLMACTTFVLLIPLLWQGEKTSKFMSFIEKIGKYIA